MHSLQKKHMYQMRDNRDPGPKKPDTSVNQPRFNVNQPQYQRQPAKIPAPTLNPHRPKQHSITGPPPLCQPHIPPQKHKRPITPHDPTQPLKERSERSGWKNFQEKQNSAIIPSNENKTVHKKDVQKIQPPGTSLKKAPCKFYQIYS
jgi:hypothetical protein